MRLLVILALISAACAKPQPDGRIIGGSVAAITSYPFMTSMRFRWNEGFYHSCGGTLITNRAVLSTASCFVVGCNIFGCNSRSEQKIEGITFHTRIPEPANWLARLGTNNLLTGGVYIPVSEFVVHSNFDQKLARDNIVVIRLASAAPLSNTINIARIAGANYTVPDNSRVYTAGFGITAPFSGLSYELRHVDVRVVNHAVCTSRYADLSSQESFEWIPPVWPGNLCTGLLGVGGQDACSGDTGGPVVHQGDVLIGITDWAFECADPYYPRVNTRISSYVQWIVEKAS